MIDKLSYLLGSWKCLISIQVRDFILLTEELVFPYWAFPLLCQLSRNTVKQLRKHSSETKAEVPHCSPISVARNADGS